HAPPRSVSPTHTHTHTHTHNPAVRLKPTSSPANILIAALLPFARGITAERVAFPPESSNLMYGMYCWIGRRRIISASAENRGHSRQRKHPAAVGKPL